MKLHHKTFIKERWIGAGIIAAVLVGVVALANINLQQSDSNSDVLLSANQAATTSGPASSSLSTSSLKKALSKVISKESAAPPPVVAKIAPAPVTQAPAVTMVTTTAAAATSPMDTSSAQTTVAQTNLPPEITPDPQTIVGVLCYYNVVYKDEQTGQTIPGDQPLEVRGSGTIIDSHGDILTNRHVVVQPDDTTTATDDAGNLVTVTISYNLDRCEVGQLPAGTHLPSSDQIRTFNPYVQIPVLGYTAMPAYVSQNAGLSDNEVQGADFAVLKITGITKEGPTFGVTSVPTSFPFAKFLAIQHYPQISGEVLTYGFPGDVTQGQGNSFSTLTMTGSVGSVTNIGYGDQFYANTPLTIYTDLEIAHGRSGSPLFWRGYVIGMVTFFVGDNRNDSGSVAADAIIKGLQLTPYRLSQG